MKIVGYPRLTNYGYFLDKKTVLPKKRKFTIGIAFEDELNYQNLSQEIYTYRDFDFIEYGGKVEFELTYAIISHGTFLRVVNMFANRDDVHLIIRPRLIGKKETYSFLTEDVKNIFIDIEESPYSFFKNIDCMITCMSSIGTEAQIAGIPVISTLDLFSEEFKHLRFGDGLERLEHFWRPRTYEEIAELVDKAKNGMLAVVRDNDSFVNFLKRVYVNCLTDGHPSKMIAEDLRDIFENYSSIKNEFRNKIIVGYNYTFFKSLLNPKLRISLFSYPLFKSFYSSNIIVKLLGNVIYYLYRLNLFIKFKSKKLADEVFMDFDHKLFTKYQKIFKEINLFFDKKYFKDI